MLHERDYPLDLVANEMPLFSLKIKWKKNLENSHEGALWVTNYRILIFSELNSLHDFEFFWNQINDIEPIREGYSEMVIIKTEKDNFSILPLEFDIKAGILAQILYVTHENFEQQQKSLRPEFLFDNLKMHPLIINSSRQLFIDGHYSLAIFEACKLVNKFVREKSGKCDLDGQSLMSNVFSHEHPIIKINSLSNESEKDEQKGFMYLYMGLMTGVRNPKAHDFLNLKNPYRALKYLSLASLLLERADEGRV